MVLGLYNTVLLRGYLEREKKCCVRYSNAMLSRHTMRRLSQCSHTKPWPGCLISSASSPSSPRNKRALPNPHSFGIRSIYEASFSSPEIPMRHTTLASACQCVKRTSAAHFRHVSAHKGCIVVHHDAVVCNLLRSSPGSACRQEGLHSGLPVLMTLLAMLVSLSLLGHLLVDALLGGSFDVPQCLLALACLCCCLCSTLFGIG